MDDYSSEGLAHWNIEIYGQKPWCDGRIGAYVDQMKKFLNCSKNICFKADSTLNIKSLKGFLKDRLEDFVGHENEMFNFDKSKGMYVPSLIFVGYVGEDVKEEDSEERLLAVDISRSSSYKLFLKNVAIPILEKICS